YQWRCSSTAERDRWVEGLQLHIEYFRSMLAFNSANELTALSNDTAGAAASASSAT
ncbi:MAG: hypothetical protein MHM6MM_007301, partial [Cercozoa sp. M6MM]